MNHSETNTIYCISAYLLTTLWLSSLIAGGVFANANGLPWVSLTVTDFKKREIHLTLPLQRIVIIDSSSHIILAAYALKILHLLVGIDQDTAKNDTIFPEGPLCQVVGHSDDPDVALISGLSPDLVLVGNIDDKTISKMEKARLSVASISVFPNQCDGFEPTVDISQMLESVLGELKEIPARFDRNV